MTIAITLAVIAGMTGFTAAATTYDSSVTLDNKESNWALTPCDGIGAVIEYNFAADNFEWSASGTVPVSGVEYSLIYYADYTGSRFGHWGGDNPGALIGTMMTDSNGDFTAAGSKDLGMDLPCSPDANMAEHDYSGAPDYYTHAHGAKLWMVPSVDYAKPMTAYHPTNYLFETDLITYTRDAGISIGDGFSCEGDITPVTIPILISNADDVGSVHLTLTYDESLVTVTGVMNGNMDSVDYMVGTDQVNILANQNSAAVINGEFVLAYIEFTPDDTATGTSDFGIIVTSFLDDTDDTLAMPYLTRAGAYDVHAYTIGDVNDNDVVDSGDVMVLAKYVAGLCDFKDINECAADIDCDSGVIDVNDVAYLARHLLGDTSYPLPYVQ